MSQETLEVTDIDPVTFQIIKHRLFRVTDEAVTALKRVSGTPVTNEGHDLMVSLYTKDGALMTGGVGFLHHYVGASRAVKSILDRFEGDIAPGDMFMLNDPYTAALHPPDVYIINPIFHGGELRTFSASFVHVNDIGAIDAGGFSPNATSVFHEGFQTPGLKLIERGEMRDDILDTILNMVRDPGMVELDMRSQIAANNVATDRMEDLIGEYGADTVDTVAEILIDQSEKKLRNRLRELPDGVWQERQYIDSTPEDKIFTIDLTVEKDGDSLQYDFTGSSEASEYGLNCSYWTAVGGVCAPIFPLLGYDITWNDGVFEPIDVEAPEGSIVNAQRPAPISIATVATLQSCNNLSTLLTSRMLGSTDEYQHRATGVWHGAHGAPLVTVNFEGGGTVVDMLTDTFGGAGGARAHSDGVDVGGEVPNLVARWGNVERHESILPVIYLYRYFVADSGGAGQNRGGVGHEYAITPVTDEGIDEMSMVNFGRATWIPPSTGVFGGYPGCTSDYSLYRDTDLWEQVGDFPLTPENLGETSSESVPWGVFEIEKDDVFHLRFTGSGGYGDPLERDPETVARDVADGMISPRAAREVYGVPVAEDGTMNGDVEARRAELRQQRLAGSNDPTSPVAYGDTEPTRRRLGPHLEVRRTDERLYTACENCETVIASMEDNWREETICLDDPISSINVGETGPEDCRLRRFVCFSCGQLLDTEVALADQPYLETRLFD